MQANSRCLHLARGGATRLGKHGDQGGHTETQEDTQRRTEGHCWRVQGNLTRITRIDTDSGSERTQVLPNHNANEA